MSRVYAVISPGKITDTSAVRKPKMADAVANGIGVGVIGANWSTIQTTSGGAVTVSGIQNTLDDALNVGMKVVLQINLQYPPSFVTSGVEQFKDQNAVLWTDSDGTGAAGDRVRNWQWTAQGRTYVADLFTKLGTSGIASHPALMGARLGGGYSGEAHYAPITTSPMQWWIYGTSLQTGTGLASDQVVCPHPGRTPLFNGTNDAFDHDIANWWLNGMSVWINWLIAQHKSAGFGSTNFQNLWVLHPSTGVRDRPHSDSAWIQEVARGVDPRRLMAAYSHDTKTWPWSTWNDNTGSSTSETGMGSCVKLLQEAKVYGKLARFACENSHTNSDINACLTVFKGVSADNATGSGGWLFNWLNYDSLVGGAVGDITMSQYRNLTSNLITPEAFGAVGNGTTDDTTALNNALGACDYGKQLVLAAGKQYKHTTVLSINVPGTTITGSGTLLATVEDTSAVKINANDVTIDGPTLKMSSTTFRGDQLRHHKLHITKVSGAIVKNVTIDGSHAAGIFVEGARNYLIQDCSVSNTLADGIHQTAGANNGIVRRPRLTNVGDDGVAVVSYLSDGVLCHDITVDSPHIVSQTAGRGVSVVGGYNVTFTSVVIDSSNSAAVYFASETGSFNTYSVYNVTVNGATIANANQNAAVDHGAIVIWCAQSSQTIHDITIQNVSIANTRTTASRNIGLLQDAGSLSNITMTNVAITGSGTPISNFLVDQSSGNYTSSGWTVSGVAQSAHTGPVLVTAFGATGNGVTDDKAAIQNAINSASSGANKNVVFPVGTYLISGFLTIPTTVRLVGTDRVNCVIKNTAVSSRGDNLGGTTMLKPSAQGNANNFIGSLTLDQRGDYYDPTFGDSPNDMCISIDATSGFMIQDSDFKNIRTMAVWCDSFPAHPTTNHTFQRDHVFQAGGDGVSYFGQHSGIKVLDNTFENTKDDAIAFQSTSSGSTGQSTNNEARRNQILNCTGRTSYGSTPHGILVQGGTNITIQANNIVNIYSTGIHCYNFGSWALSNITIDGNTVNGTHVGYPGNGATGAPGDGVWISGAGTNLITITNNTVTNVGSGSVAFNIISSTNVTRSGNSPTP